MIRLAKRERYLAYATAISLAVWAIFVFFISPALERIETLKRVIPQQQRVLAQLNTNSAWYLELCKEIDHLKIDIADQEKNFEPLAFLESATKRLNLKNNVVTMKQEQLPLDETYDQIIIELKLEDISLEQLVELLLEIKSSDHFLQTKSLYAKKNTANNNTLDTVIQVSTLKQPG